jgi:hypothetical protein
MSLASVNTDSRPAHMDATSGLLNLTRAQGHSLWHRQEDGLCGSKHQDLSANLSTRSIHLRTVSSHLPWTPNVSPLAIRTGHEKFSLPKPVYNDWTRWPVLNVQTLFFRNEGKIKKFPDKKKLRKFIPTSSALWEMLKEIPLEEIKGH